jgi:transcriptional regulator with XRE-family HTH domain
MKINDWLHQEFVKWESSYGRRKTVSEFAIYVGVSQSLMSHYLNGTRTPAGDNIEKISAKLGNEIYDILGIPRPDPVLQAINNNWDNFTQEEREAMINVLRHSANSAQTLQQDLKPNK